MNTQDHFLQIGGEFLLPFDKLEGKLKNVKAFIFDWDGVFNQGVKEGDAGSPFSEADSMGTNLLRFGFYLVNGVLPHTGIITGENNQSSFFLARREHFDTVHFKFKHKIEALRHLNDQYGITGEEVAFVFDDVLDIAFARECGLRFLARRDASPLFTDYVKKRGLCDYITGSSGGNHGVREVCELVLGIGYGYENVVDQRVEYSKAYQAYLRDRSEISTRFFENENGNVKELNI